MVQQTDRSRMAGEFLNRLTRLYLKLERYSDAIDAIDSEIEKYIEVKVRFFEVNVVSLTLIADCVERFLETV